MLSADMSSFSSSERGRKGRRMKDQMKVLVVQ